MYEAEIESLKLDIDELHKMVAEKDEKIQFISQSWEEDKKKLQDAEEEIERLCRLYDTPSADSPVTELTYKKGVNMMLQKMEDITKHLQSLPMISNVQTNTASPRQLDLSASQPEQDEHVKLLFIFVQSD